MNAASLQYRFGVSQQFAKRVAERAKELGAMGVAIDSVNQVYYYDKKLGSGSFGATYSARLDDAQAVGFVIKEFLDRTADDNEKKIPKQPEPPSPRGPLRFLMRILPTDEKPELPRDQYMFTKKDVEREFAVTNYVRRQLGEPFCAEYAICALNHFYDAIGETGFIVFPYAPNSVNLSEYVVKTLHPMLRAALAGNGSLTQVYTIAYDIVCRIAYAIARLHDIGVIHQDIKPDNMLVVDDRVKLIVFGIACITDAKEAFTSCNPAYMTTLIFEDPLAQ